MCVCYVTIIIATLKSVPSSKNGDHVYNGIQEFQLELAIQPSPSLQYKLFFFFKSLNIAEEIFM